MSALAEGAAEAEDVALLQVEGLGKSFGGVSALRDVSFSLRRGEVLGLAGHNGAGKSTLLNLLSGVLSPDAGSMRVQGRPFTPRGYTAATRGGVFRIYQELSVIDNLTVAENVTLGSERYVRSTGLLRPSVVRERVSRFLSTIGLDDLDPAARTGDLSLAERQLVEIVKALFQAELQGVETPVLLLDEPTSGLTQAQVTFLEAHVNAVRHRAGIVLTTHRGSELLDWSDRVLVLRGGEEVGRPDPRTTTPEQLASLMTGGEEVGTHRRAAQRPTGSRVLTLQDVRLESLAEAFSLELLAGEVVAVVGEASEKTEIARCVAGLLRPSAGRVLLDGRPVGRGVRAALAAGIRFVPADRGGEGLALQQSVCSNLTVEAMAAEGARALARSPRAERAFATGLVEKYRVKVHSLSQPAASLSGGNQQKLLVARVLSEQARVVVLDRPTRGIDVHAKSEIYRLVVEASARGTAVLIASDEPEEVLPLCDRVVVLRDGRVTAVHDCRSGVELRPSDLV